MPEARKQSTEGNLGEVGEDDESEGDSNGHQDAFEDDGRDCMVERGVGDEVYDSEEGV